MEKDNVIKFPLSEERRQELFLEAAELHERRQQILKILGMIAISDEELF